MLEWDEAKNARNMAERGLPFSLAAGLLRDESTWVYLDVRHSALEERWRAMGEVLLAQGLRLVLAVVTVRGGRIRVISLRRCKRQEREDYEQHRREVAG